MNVAEVAQIWNSAGVSTIPVLNNGTKRPSIPWGVYQAQMPTLDQVNQWWPNGKSTLGLALICGSISGNLEMTELEAAASGSEHLDAIQQQLESTGRGDLWGRLTDGSTYMEWTPSGGIHFLYRITGHEVPGNEKIAVDAHGKVLSETRGEGGYVIVAPTSGLVHPTGESWSIAAGQYGTLAGFTWAEREILHAAIFAALDQRPVPDPRPTPAPRLPVTTGNRPGDAFAAVTDWDEILAPLGWTLSHRTGEEEYWVRPGKNKRDGHSATTNYRGSDLMKVFSSSVPELETDATYTKFGAFAALHHGGDWKAATVELAGRGFGNVPVRAQELDTLALAPSVVAATVVQAEPAGQWAPYRWDEFGMARWLFDWCRTKPKFVHHDGKFHTFNGKAWEKDLGGRLTRAYFAMTEAMLVEAEAAEDDKRVKFVRSMRSGAKCEAVIKLLRSLPDVTVGMEAFDTQKHLLNLDNVTLDVKSGQVLPHNPDHMLTRVMAAPFDEQATCPRFASFMEQVQPDPEMREYVQRAVGYSLLGRADQRALFLAHGKTGTGKSTFISVISRVMGDYAATAPAGTFTSGKDKGATPDLHRLRGKRFVTTSETGENTAFDEDLLKRLTGRDMISSRALYQDFQEWIPECAIWIATNFPPKFNSDDDAIWGRAKLIPFTTVISETGPEIPDLASIIVETETAGVLNWMLEGLASYLVQGLAEPAAVKAGATAHRESNDSATRFYNENVADGFLNEGEECTMRTQEMVAMYASWAAQSGERPLGPRRFINRLLSAKPNLKHVSVHGHMLWVGVQRAPGAGFLGLIPPTRE